MGLANPALRFIAREHRRKPLTGPILTLECQDVFATLDEARSLLASEGIPPVACRREKEPTSTLRADWIPRRR